MNLRTFEAFKITRSAVKGLRMSPTDKRWHLFSIVLIILGIPLHQPLLIVAGSLLLLTLGITDIWALYCLDNLTYQRQFSEQRVLFAEEVTLSLTIENAKLLPLPWLEVEDTIPRALTIKGHKAQSRQHNDITMLENLFSPRWYERITRRYTVQCNARGLHTFGPTRLRSSDVFGFFSRERELSNRQYVLVYPLVAPLHSFGLPARHPFGDKRAPQRLLEDPSRVVGARDYVYGDSLRRVNWKATARTMKMQSKIYETTTTHTLVLFLNVTSQLDIYYGIRPDLQELSICATASVANWALDQGYAVGLYANTILFKPDEEFPTTNAYGTENTNTDQTTAMPETASTHWQRRRIHLPAANNEEQRKRIMETLARTQAFFGFHIEEVLHTERTHLPAGATVVVVSSTINEQLIDVLSRIRLGGHSVTILFIGDTPAPIKPAGINIYHLGGAETWTELVNAYSKTSDEEKEKQTAQPLIGLRL